EFSLILNMLQLNDFEQDFSLKSDFSRRHSCPNPPALAGGRLRNKSHFLFEGGLGLSVCT
ncbi:hypothetical protein, partial [Oceanobacillus oncorhynchi]|uniref:hypothetical protein n=1 Tax=Oceanobacillus oncorhynchi TaxID=545501 RepID=UPI0031D3FEA7